jgi:hypothetical protein
MPTVGLSFAPPKILERLLRADRSNEIPAAPICPERGLLRLQTRARSNFDRGFRIHLHDGLNDVRLRPPLSTDSRGAAPSIATPHHPPSHCANGTGVQTNWVSNQSGITVTTPYPFPSSSHLRRGATSEL